LQPSINHSYDKICSNQTKNQTVANLAKPTTEPKVAPAASIENSTSTCGAPVTSSANESSISSLYRRLIVLDVEDTANEKKLRMYDEKNPTSELYIFLRDDWKTIHVYSGDIANIIGRPEAKSDPNAVDIYIVDRERNVFILHPDVFVTGSTLGESFQCVRRAVLGAKVKSKLENPRALYGKLNHEIFQRGISLGDFTSNTLNKYVDNLVVAFIESIYALGMSENEIRERLHKFLPSIQSWGQKYFKQPLTSNANCFVDFIPSGTKKYKVSVKQALKTEENIWSLMYGIKGNIDVSVEAFLQILQRTDKIQKTVYLPLELKTGSLDPSHCTQIIIYALLMMDRYNIPVPAGFLVSLEKNRMLGISVTRDRVQEALIKRNEVAYYLTIQKLPPILRQKHICNSCYAIDTCAIYHKALEKGTYESSLLEKFNEKTQYLTDKSCDFLKHWEELLDLEAQEVFKINKEIWSMDSTTREKLGRCLGQMIIDNVKKTENDTYIYCFKKANGNTSQRCTFNILDIQINPGDQVVLRGEEKNVGIATGTVIEVTSTHITVELPSELKVPLSAAITTNMSASQRFPEIGDIEDLAMARNIFREISGSELELNFRWRIDKDELISGFSYARTNLLKLFQAENGDEKRRRLIVDLEKPLFTTDPVKCHSELLTQNRCKFGVNLNPDQERAVLKILSAQDYALILGMPGTGKTTTIAHIVSLLVSLGKSVLLSAYTHSAVDNLLLKLKAIGIPFLRLGSKHQVHPELHRFIFNFDGSLRTVKDIEKKFNEVKVVALTCMSVGHILLQRQKFDYCIVDEASQLTLPICLGPISLCKIFVLVGDIYQLPPLVRSNEAKRKGLDVSLFKYLAEAHPQAVVTLEYQYRMNEDIMTLSNTLIYHNRLRCGTPQIAHSTLELSPEQLPRFIGESLSQEKHDWIREILKPTRRVVFLNTDEIPAPEIQIGDLVKNVIEASLVATFTAALVDVGVNPSAIGIISPWRSQLKEIRQQLGLHSLVAIEVHTVDKYQGRDKDCVIISLVRNNAKRNVGNLLRDWHRVNVAFTRAKKKLIVFGSRSTLCGNHLFQSFLELIDRRGWCYNLPKDAHTLYQRREHVFSNSQQRRAQHRSQESSIT
jgi:DNA replication ATP-dependent helicase Dna2